MCSTDADVESHQPGSRVGDVDRQRAVHDGDGRRERPRLHSCLEHSASDHEIGIIPIDAVYSPVTRVRYEIEETRVGQKTNYDKLTLEIWTNGSIHPEMAMVEAAKILRKHLNPFVQYTELGTAGHMPASAVVRVAGSGAGGQAES